MADTRIQSAQTKFTCQHQATQKQQKQNHDEQKQEAQIKCSRKPSLAPSRARGEVHPRRANKGHQIDSPCARPAAHRASNRCLHTATGTGAEGRIWLDSSQRHSLILFPSLAQNTHFLLAPGFASNPATQLSNIRDQPLRQNSALLGKIQPRQHYTKHGPSVLFKNPRFWLFRIFPKSFAQFVTDSPSNDVGCTQRHREMMDAFVFQVDLPKHAFFFCMCIFVCLYVCMCVCVCVCVCVCGVCVCVCVCV